VQLSTSYEGEETSISFSNYDLIDIVSYCNIFSLTLAP